MDFSMNVSIIEIKQIKADAGMVLTNGREYSSVGGLIFLGVNENENNWYEITEQEYIDICEQDNQLNNI